MNNTRCRWSSLGDGCCGGVSSALVYWKVISVRGKLRNRRGQGASDHHTELKVSVSLAEAPEQRWHIRGAVCLKVARSLYHCLARSLAEHHDEKRVTMVGELKAFTALGCQLALLLAAGSKSFLEEQCEQHSLCQPQ